MSLNARNDNAHAPIALEGVNDLIGNTPLLRCERLEALMPGARLWAKLEHFNPGGSAKDRTAFALVEEAIAQGVIEEDAPVTLVESSSGNLGMALARQAQLRGWTFHCVVDQRTNAATVASMRALGARIEFVEKPDPKTGDWLVARRKRVADLLDAIPGAINLDQYSNQAAFRAHQRTMEEILQQLGGAPDYFFAAMSTTGTIGGCIRQLDALGATTRTIGVDAEGSVLFGGARATRLLPGYGAGVEPELAKHVNPTKVERVRDLDAVIGARILARTEGVIPGASGGAVVAAVLREELPAGCDAVFLLHDAGGNYMDTIYNDAWVAEHLHADAETLEQKIQEALQ
ncbi:pyridoxal-phosphate dependent enzyme [Corynebacterium gerontici]|uniref:Putative siderophore biosynthesis protein SbnA n=1 Tax=Corynebacterium gerontici TaxID=2079234 RepID=A0A3G6J1K6_9CORY|nr:pyridoxal-phosphate dependent enzyme [Corynebacterium gerontici]AZA11862.1 putative siderophore biosynthesis protein SbnA [Corynebacterium gerontici]